MFSLHFLSDMLWTVCIQNNFFDGFWHYQWQSFLCTYEKRRGYTYYLYLTTTHLHHLFLFDITSGSLLLVERIVELAITLAMSHWALYITLVLMEYVLSLFLNKVIFRRWYYGFNECVPIVAPMTFRKKSTLLVLVLSVACGEWIWFPCCFSIVFSPQTARAWLTIIGCYAN